MTSLVARVYLTRKPAIAASVPSAMSRWDLPVPESPIRQSGWPFLTQSQVARVWMTAGSMCGLASKSKSRSDFSAGERGGLDPAFGAAAGAVVALGQQQFGEEPAVGHLLTGRRVGELGELVADGGQAQHPAGLVDRGVGGLLGHAAAAAWLRSLAAVSFRCRRCRGRRLGSSWS